MLRLARFRSRRLLKKVSFLSRYLLPTHKKNYAYVTDSQYSSCLLKEYSRLQHLPQTEHLVASETSDFLFWLIFLVSSPSLTTIRLPHPSSVNTSLGKSSKFPMPSIIVSSSSVSTITNTTRFVLSFSLKTRVSVKIKLEKLTCA